MDLEKWDKLYGDLNDLKELYELEQSANCYTTMKARECVKKSYIIIRSNRELYDFVFKDYREYLEGNGFDNEFLKCLNLALNFIDNESSKLSN